MVVELVRVAFPAFRLLALTVAPLRTVAARLLTVALEMVVDPRVEEPVVYRLVMTALVETRPVVVVVPVVLVVDELRVVKFDVPVALILLATS